MDRKVSKTKNPSTKSSMPAGFGQKILYYIKTAGKFIGKAVVRFGQILVEAWHGFLKSFAAWSDPKLEPYREKRSPESKMERIDPVIVEETTYAPTSPETRDDLFALLREAPMTVLNGQERKMMTSILNLPNVWVSEVMTRGSKVVFVDKNEVLGPLILDKLYRSGFTHFPVIDGREQIIGTLHTAQLNSLDVKETKTAREVMQRQVYYIRDDYNLEQALKAFLRTGSQIMVVIDRYEKFKGVLTFEQITNYIFTEKFQDEFDRDDDRSAVSKRRA